MDPDQQRKTTAAGVVVLVFVAGTALVAGAVPGVMSAQATNEIDSCTTISEPGTYELTADIGNSDADRCLLIETADVTLEGNGHLVDGVDGPNSFGVYVDADAGDRTTVRNLTVRDWEEGVRVVDGDTVVEDVEAVSNVDGLSAQQVNDGVRFENVDVHDNTDDGIEAIDVLDLFVIDSRSADNAEDGLYLDNADDGDVRNNLVENNGENGIYGFDTDVTSFGDNVIRGNAEDGILVEARPRQGDGGAPSARAEDMSIVGNEITDNGDEGIHLRSLGRGVTVADNSVCDSGDKQFLLENVMNIEMSGNDASCR